jgi:hypothetical protein
VVAGLDASDLVRLWLNVLKAFIMRPRWLLEDAFSSEFFRESFSMLPLLGDKDVAEELFDIIGTWKDFGLSLKPGRICGVAASGDGTASMLVLSASPCRHD